MNAPRNVEIYKEKRGYLRSSSIPEVVVLCLRACPTTSKPSLSWKLKLMKSFGIIAITVVQILRNVGIIKKKLGVYLQRRQIP